MHKKNFWLKSSSFSADLRDQSKHILNILAFLERVWNLEMPSKHKNTKGNTMSLLVGISVEIQKRMREISSDENVRWRKKQIGNYFPC